MSAKLEKIQRKVMDWCWKVLKRRLPPGHVLFEEGDLYCQLSAKYLPLEMKEELKTNRVKEEFPCGYSKCCQVFDSLIKYESHYNMVHRNVCQTCSKVFPSAHLLDVHILETHDSMFELLAQKQNMYQCLLEDCETKLKTSQERRDHMIKVHHFPANYRYDRHRNKSSKRTKIKTGSKDTDCMEVDSVPGSRPCEDENQPTGRVFSYKVPKNISFGQGVPRGFNRGRGRGRGQKKHWHNKDRGDRDTTVNIEEVDMGDLCEALS